MNDPEEINEEPELSEAFIAEESKRLLRPEFLLGAYARGYFPMPHPETGRVEWFHPDPRAILPIYPKDGFHVSRSLKRRLAKQEFRVTRNHAFEDVMRGCADRSETWITEAFVEGYSHLHAIGHAHSVEVWRESTLVGGVYGVSVAGAFFAESMFHRATDASKIALFYLKEFLREAGMRLLEVQFLTPHLASLGAIEISREVYMLTLSEALRTPVAHPLGVEASVSGSKK